MDMGTLHHIRWIFICIATTSCFGAQSPTVTSVLINVNAAQGVLLSLPEAAPLADDLVSSITIVAQQSTDLIGATLLQWAITQLSSMYNFTPATQDQLFSAVFAEYGITSTDRNTALFLMLFYSRILSFYRLHGDIQYVNYLLQKMLLQDIQLSFLNQASNLLPVATPASIAQNFNLIINQLSAVTNQVSSVAGNVATVNDAVSSVATTVATVNDKVGSVASSFNDGVATLATQVGSVATNVSAVSDSVGTMAGHVVALNDNVSGIATSVSGVSDKVDAVTGSLGTVNDTLATQVGSVATTVSTVHSAVADLTNKFGNASNTISTFNDHIATLTNQVSAVADNVAIINNQFGSVASTVSTFNDNVTTLTNQVGSVASNVLTVHGNVASLANQVNAVASNVTLVNDNVLTLTTASNSTQENLSNVQTQITTMAQRPTPALFSNSHLYAFYTLAAIGFVVVAGSFLAQSWDSHAVKKEIGANNDHHAERHAALLEAHGQIDARLAALEGLIPGNHQPAILELLQQIQAAVVQAHAAVPAIALAAPLPVIPPHRLHAVSRESVLSVPADSAASPSPRPPASPSTPLSPPASSVREAASPHLDTPPPPPSPEESVHSHEASHQLRPPSRPRTASSADSPRHTPGTAAGRPLPAPTPPSYGILHFLTAGNLAYPPYVASLMQAEGAADDDDNGDLYSVPSLPDGRTDGSSATPPPPPSPEAPFIPAPRANPLTPSTDDFLSCVSGDDNTGTVRPALSPGVAATDAPQFFANRIALGRTTVRGRGGATLTHSSASSPSPQSYASQDRATDLDDTPAAAAGAPASPLRADTTRVSMSPRPTRGTGSAATRPPLIAVGTDCPPTESGLLGAINAALHATNNASGVLAPSALTPPETATARAAVLPSRSPSLRRTGAGGAAKPAAHTTSCGRIDSQSTTGMSGFRTTPAASATTPGISVAREQLATTAE